MFRFAFLLAILVALPAERFRPGYEASSTFEFHDEGREDMHLDDITVEVAGMEVPEEMLEQMRAQMRSDKSKVKDVRVLTTVHEVAEGRIRDVSHELDRLELELTTDGEDELRTGALEGRTIRMTRDDAGDFQVVAIDGEEDFDPELVEEVGFRPDFNMLLPSSEVSEGDTWPAGDEFFEAELAWLSVDLLDDDDEDGDSKAKLQDFLKGAFGDEPPQVTWTATETHDDERIALLVLALETPFDAVELLLSQGTGVPRGAELSGRGDLALELTLHWSLTRGLPHRLHGNLAVRADLGMSFPLEEDVTMLIEMVLDGTIVNDSTWSYTR